MRAKSSIVFAVVCLAAVLLVGYFYLWRERDEQIINRKLDELVTLAEKTGEEAPFYTLTQSREILKFIAAEPEIRFGRPLPVLDDRDELGVAIAQVRQTLQTLSIRITDRQITLGADGETAEMEVEAVANVSYAGEAGEDRRRFALTWIKEEGEWMIQRVLLIQGDALPDFEVPL